MNVLDRPSPEEAGQFAIMLDAGCPAEEAIRYFYEGIDKAELAGELARWVKSARVRTALTRIEGKSWLDMTLEERIDAALNRHYNALAWFAHQTNYTSASQIEKAKLDTARVALEAKRAGTAGAGDPLSRFFADIQSGKLVLPGSIPPPTTKMNS